MIKKYIISFLVLVIICPAIYAKTYISNIEGEITYGSLDKSIIILNKLTKNDVIIIQINSPGGSVLEEIKISKAIHNTKGKVVAVVGSQAASAAGFIMFQADEIYVKEYSLILIHPVWYYNDNSETVICDDQHKKVGDCPTWFAYLISKLNTLSSYLTSEERSRVLNGNDVIILGKELSKRNSKIQLY